MNESERAFVEYLKLIDGIRLPTVFYRSWSRKQHPIQPKGLINFSEAQRGDVYYEASYREINDQQRLVLFEKFSLSKTLIDVPDRDALATGAEFAAYDPAGQRNATVLSPDEALLARRYVWLERDGDGNFVAAHAVVQKPVFAYEYKYDDSGSFVSVNVTQPDSGDPE